MKIMMNQTNDDTSGSAPRLRSLLKWLAFTASAMLTAAYISAEYFQLLLIQGDSMQPSYSDLQLVILDKCSKSYCPGDVIAFKCDGLSAVLVKRVAAVPKDTVIISDGRLLVNGMPSDVYPDSLFNFSGILENAVVLDNDEYIVIGDNISESKDSRYESVGIVSAEDIIGRVM